MNMKTLLLFCVITAFCVGVTTNGSISKTNHINTACTEPEPMIHGGLFFFLVLDYNRFVENRQSVGLPALEYNGPWPPVEQPFEGNNYGIWSVNDELACQQLQQFVDTHDTPETGFKYFYQTETHYFIIFTSRTPTMVSYGGRSHIFVFDAQMNFLGRTRG